MKALRLELERHVGGAPSVAQRILIDQATQLTLRIAAMDRRFAKTGEQTEHDSRTYLAWSNSLSRLLRELGLKAAATKPPSITELMRTPPRAAA